MNETKRDSGLPIQIGDTVTWRSQANGHWKRKRGVVRAVVEAGDKPQRRAFLLDREHGAKWCIVFDGFTPARKRRYLVEVPGSSARAKPRLYCPTAALTVVGAEGNGHTS